MNIILFDSANRQKLYPLNMAKPNACLRMGAFTFLERWQKIFPKAQISTLSEAYLQEKFPTQAQSQNIFINPLFLPHAKLIKNIENLSLGESIFKDQSLVAFCGSKEDFSAKNYTSNTKNIEELIQIQFPWDFFTHNKKAFQFDVELLTQNQTFTPVPEHVKVTGNPKNVYLEEGVTLENCILNTTEGSIYIAKNATIMDGSIIRGNSFIGENSTVKMGAKIYGETTIGPSCKVGGEVGNSILMQNSNKGHDGYLGNSVIGEWCNLGADTNTSNLKNNYSKVDCWSEFEKKYVATGLQFAGLIMGDHSKSAINTQFNTGTVVGFSSNIFMSGFPPKHIQSYSFGGNKNSPLFSLPKAIEVAKVVMKRRNVSFTSSDEHIFTQIANIYLNH